MNATRVTATLLLAIALCAGCRRPQVEPRGELAGVWLREPGGTSGFELRHDESLALIGEPARSGLAWNTSHGELVLAMNSSERVDSSAVHLRILSLSADALELASAEDESLAGRYRRAPAAAHVRGVVTYREHMPLPDDARVAVVLTQIGVGPVATQAFVARQAVPIGFELALVPAPGAAYALTARISDRERTWFATPEPLSATPDGPELEVLLRSTR
jgi:uncharacterized lipoprotein YbaY